MVLDFLAVDNFDFTRKIFKKNLGKKLAKLLFFLSKFDFTNSVILKSSRINGVKLDFLSYFQTLCMVPEEGRFYH